MKLVYKGISLTVAQWAKHLNISESAFRQRITDMQNEDKIFSPNYFRKSKGKTQRHGGSRSRSYYSWLDMHRRCSPNSQKSHRYYNRGIRVCKRWMLFNNFLEDMGERPIGTTLDRYPNNDGNYEKKNCRWATPKQQGRNTSVNRIFYYQGKRLTMVELAENVGIPYYLLRVRLHRGMPLAKALTNGDLRCSGLIS